LLSGDLGTQPFHTRPVWDTSYPPAATIELTIVAMVVAVVIGIRSAWSSRRFNRNRSIDHVFA